MDRVYGKGQDNPSIVSPFNITLDKIETIRKDSNLNVLKENYQIHC